MLKETRKFESHLPNSNFLMQNMMKYRIFFATSVSASVCLSLATILMNEMLLAFNSDILDTEFEQIIAFQIRQCKS